MPTKNTRDRHEANFDKHLRWMTWTTNIKMMRWKISEKTWFDIDLKWDLYLSKHSFKRWHFWRISMETTWRWRHLQRNSSGSAKIETLKTTFKLFTKISPYQIRHRLEVKQKDWRSPQLVPISTLLYTARKNVKTSFWMDRHIFFGGVFCGDARTTRLWVVSVGNVKFVRLLCFSGFRLSLDPYVWSKNLNKFQSGFHFLKHMINDTDVICVCKDIYMVFNKSIL